MTKGIEPLYCFAISAKRYVLYSLDGQGRPVIRKASAHGLGHLLPPYSEGDAPAGIPSPAVPLSDIGVDRWQYDLWYKIVQAALAGQSHQVRLDYHPALTKPALMRFGLSSPRLEAWMGHWNEDRPYTERARPFGFMVVFQRRETPWADTILEGCAPKRARRAEAVDIRPVAPFNRDPEQAADAAFDRESGDAVTRSRLKTYAEALSQFHLHPEDKFRNGNYFDRGPTDRRHVFAMNVGQIGKEANNWGFDMPAERSDVAEFCRTSS